MTTRKRYVAAIALLLMALFLGTACNPGGGVSSSTEATVSAVRAMTQYADTPNAGTGGTYTPSNFTADDGTVIEFGTFKTDANGNIIEADITMRLTNGQELKFTMVPSTVGSDPTVTVGDDTVPSSSIPVAMTPDENRAFVLFLVSFEEMQDDIRETIEEAVELLEETERTAGTHNVNHRGVTGTVDLRVEEWDDGRPELEIVGWDVSFTDLRLEDSWARGVSGTHRFSERGERETSEMDITIDTYSENSRLVLTDVVIDGTIVEDEKWDEDTFTFNGTLAGSFTIGSGSSSDIRFSGSIDAMEDAYLRFPEYSLTINGKDCAIGRETKPFRN